jgi:ABC-type transporter Mla subunit MlaD
VWKNRIVSFAVGLALGVLGTAGAILAGQSGDPGELAKLDRANQLETERTVASLERVIGEQRERIDDLEASNSRLDRNIRDARGISAELTESARAAGTDIRSAITLLKTIKDQVYRLNGVLNRGDTGGGGSGGVAGMDAGG